MSTEYEANSGLGYRVIASDAIKDSEALEDGLHEYIFNECSQGFDFFQVGNASNGVIDGTYLCIKNPFKLGIDIRWAKVILDSEIARLKLTTVDNFGVVGGLYIS